MSSTSSLPAGTVTFFFSDIEGSTQLVQRLEERFDELLEQHRVLMRATFAAHGGHEISTEGDSFFVAFSHAEDALAAAVEAQLALANHPWPEDAAIRVRMGMHTGEARLINDDYIGLAVHLASRVCSAAHGQQVLVSGATVELAGGQLPPRASTIDLGEHGLKDIARPVRLFQLAHPGLRERFPPVRTASALRHNLPVPLTSFIGRETEMREVRKLLEQHRLVTLTGTGGSGKTRLAVQLGTELLDTYENGVWFVDLAPVAEADLVPMRVADAVGLGAPPGGSVEAALEEFFAPKPSLLILDNCEHLVDASGRLAASLLLRAPHLDILATSRELLGVGGEVAWRVPSFDLPPDAPADELAGCEAVRLFVDRASASDPSFSVSPEDLVAVSQICRRLDGIPLAIELAAARTDALAPQQIAARLDDRFRLLVGSRSSLARQQTLQALVDWSYDLLEPGERLLLARLSVFAGSFTLEAVEAICAGSGVDSPLEHLTGLVRKSLVNVERRPGAVRYRLLQTIRQYGQERLGDDAGEANLRRRHTEYYLAVAEKAASALVGPDQRDWLDRLDEEHNNLRAAMAWSIETGAASVALRVGCALRRFWWVRGHLAEGRSWLERAIEAAGGNPTPLLAEALWAAGYLSTFLDDGAAAGYVEQALQMATALDDRRRVGWATFSLGQIAGRGGDFEQTRARCGEALEIARAVDDPFLELLALGLLGATSVDDLDTALRLHTDALPLARVLGDPSCEAQAVSDLGYTSLLRGDYPAADKFTTEALRMRSDLGDRGGVAVSHFNLAHIALRQNDRAGARAHFEEALVLFGELGNQLGVEGSSAGLAALLDEDGE